jgi:hypothetical protein
VSPLSSRFAWAILSVALIAGVPVAVHTLRLADRDDCAHPELLHPLTFSNVSDLEEPKAPANPMTITSVRGTVTAAGSVPPLRFAIERKFEPAGISRKPSESVVHEMEISRKELTWFERGDSRVPIHWVSESQRNGIRFASYLFIYDLEPTASPRTSVLASAFPRLFTGGRPLTLFAIGGEVRRKDEESAREAAEAWLLSAWDQYRSACRP